MWTAREYGCYSIRIAAQCTFTLTNNNNFHVPLRRPSLCTTYISPHLNSRKIKGVSLENFSYIV